MKSMKAKSGTALLLASFMMIAPITVFSAEAKVTTLQELTDAIVDGNTIILDADIDGSITIPEDTTVTLQLNGHTLTNAAGADAITNNGSLTISGEGSIVNKIAGKGVLVNMPGANAKITGGTLEGQGWYTIKNLGDMEIEKDTKVISSDPNSSLIANGWYGNAQNDRNTVYDASKQENAKLTISGGSFSGGMNTVKNDDYGVLNISGGSFTNTSGPTVLNWNEATISDGEFEAPNGPVLANSAYADSKADQGILTVTGGTFVSGNNGEEPLFTYALGGTGKGSLNIKGGTFQGIVDTDNNKNEVKIEKGTFTKAVTNDYVSDDAVSVSLSSKDSTIHYIGTQDEVLADLTDNAMEGNQVVILKGDLDFDDSQIPDGLEIKNDGDGTVIVNGTQLNQGDEPIVTHTHEAEAIPAKAATCEEDGNIAYWYCEACDKYFSDAALTNEITVDETVVKATGHSSANVEAVPAKLATCEEDGNIAYWHCKACDKYFSDAALTKEITKEQTIIRSLQHIANIEVVPAKEATCEEDGNIAYWHCKACDKYFSDEALTKEITFDQTVVKANGHDAASVEAVSAKEATCEEDGNIAYWYCKACDKYFSDEALTKEITFDQTVIKAKGHDAASVEAVSAKEATCEEDGNIAYWYCKACDKYFSDEALTKEIMFDQTVIKAKGHDAASVEAVPAKAATANSDGNIAYWHCKVCDKYFSDEALTKEITLKDTIITTSKVSDEQAEKNDKENAVQKEDKEAAAQKDEAIKTPNTGDTTNCSALLSLVMLQAITLAGVYIVQKRKALR